MDRLKSSLAAISIHYPQSDELPAIGEKLIQLNEMADGEALLYIQITRGAAPRFHGFPPIGTEPTTYAVVSPRVPTGGKLPDGISAITVSDSRWGRCDIKSVSLLPNVLAFQHARENGSEEVLFLRDGVVTEGSHNSLFAVFGGVVTTAPLSNAILPGITRGVVLELCKDLKLEVIESAIPDGRIFEADEWFITGTSSEITPVIRIDQRSVGDGMPGPITRKLHEAFQAYVKSTATA